ncbi:MAG: 30S ribosomal protein S21 [Myxococcales bacterium FL481]|nr:MAG: 30S ribosomal protein S21 [Myxococcales bacterium FL481]
MTGQRPAASSEEAEQPVFRVQNEHVPVLGRPLEVKVDERGVERAIRKLRRLIAGEGVLREIKHRRHHEKPSIKLKRKTREAERRRKRRQKKARTVGDFTPRERGTAE